MLVLLAERADTRNYTGERLLGISHYFGDLITNSPDSVVTLLQRS